MNPTPCRRVVDELRRNLGSIHIDLDAAREEEGIALVDAMLDAEPNQLDRHFRQALHAHTGGHPLFVVELLRDLQASGGLVQDRDGYWLVGARIRLGGVAGPSGGDHRGAYGSAEQRRTTAIEDSQCAR